MIVSRVSSCYNNRFSFGRRLTKEEEHDYKENVIKPTLKYLGVEELAMIIHGSAYPKSKNDIGIGSPYGKSATNIMAFEQLHGFNSNQLGPVGEIKSPLHISPYESSVNTKNYLFIDFSKLTKKEYGQLITPEDIEFASTKDGISKQNYTYSDFPNAFANYKYLVRKAYKRYSDELLLKSKVNPDIVRLKEEQDKFEKTNFERINNGALFYVLSKHYGTDDFSKWNNIDKNLLNKDGNTNSSDSIERLEYLYEMYGQDIEEYKFAQFIIDKQIKENTEDRKKTGFKYISDMLVGFSPADEWSHQDLFLKEYRLGCPYGGPDGGLQRWNIPVLNPKKLFNADGSLGPAGEYLKFKLEDALTNFDNVRIDHTLGLVDPYIYSKNGNRSGNISAMNDIDPDKNFEKVLNKIIIPTLEEHGLDKNDPVWEDLVTDTPVFNRIYHYENNIPGITQLEYRKAEGMENSQNWTLIGSHDSDPANLMIKKNWVRQNEAWNPMYLAGVLNASHDSREYCKKIDSSDSERVKAKFAEMFMMGKKIQISFADFFGINKTYNQGGNNKNPNNWKLRLNKNFEDTYYENLASDNPTALNMPEVLKLAVKGKSDMDIAKGTENAIDKQNYALDLITKLDKYEKILKE